MNTLLIVSVVLTALFLGVALLVAFWFYQYMKSERGQKSEGITMLAQQVESLRSQLNESMAQTNSAMAQQVGMINNQVQNQMSTVIQGLQSTTGQINTRLDNAAKVVQGVAQQLGSLSQATEKIFEATKNISTLEDILKPPKLRGGMGEILLENVLAEILPSRDFFTLQYSFKSGDTVDAVIRLKEGLIPIDAKFPLDNFRRMIESKEDKERETLRKEFVRNVKKHIDDIAGKYILPDETVFNFALMYIPAENVYYETIIRDEADDGSDLYSYSTKKHVFPVSPNSIYPYLMTLALGLRGLKIEQQAKEILGELSRVYGDLERFSKDFRTVGDHLMNASKKYDEAEKRLERVDVRLVSLKEGADNAEQSDLILWDQAPKN